VYVFNWSYFQVLQILNSYLPNINVMTLCWTSSPIDAQDSLLTFFKIIELSFNLAYKWFYRDILRLSRNWCVSAHKCFMFFISTCTNTSWSPEGFLYLIFIKMSKFWLSSWISTEYQDIPIKCTSKVCTHSNARYIEVFHVENLAKNSFVL
jgi:hypothetical protein